MKQYFEVQVYDVFVMRGNTAIFKCQIPSFVSDHVDLMEWISTENDTYQFGNDYGAKLKQQSDKSSNPKSLFLLNFLFFVADRQKFSFYFEGNLIHDYRFLPRWIQF